MNGLSLLSGVSVHFNDDNALLPLFHSDAVPYEDKIPGADIFRLVDVYQSYPVHSC